MFSALFKQAEEKKKQKELLQQAKRKLDEDEVEVDEEEDEQPEKKQKKNEEQEQEEDIQPNDKLKREIAAFLNKEMGELQNEQEVPGATKDSNLRKVVVQGFKKKPTEESIREQFGKYGEISQVLITKKGVAFIEFSSRTASKKALKEDGKGGIHVSHVKSKADDIEIPADARILFVRNIAFNVAEKEIKKLFKSCGKIIKIKLPKHKDSKKSKGIALIEFDTQQALRFALKKDRTVLKGRAILCSVSELKTI